MFAELLFGDHGLDSGGLFVRRYVGTRAREANMYISRVEFTNIRGVGEGPDGLSIDFAKPAIRARGTMAGWNVLVGPNGYGKSTILHGIAASLVGPVGSTWLLRPDDIPNWIHKGARSGTAKTWIERVAEDDGDASLDVPIRPIPLAVSWSRTGETRTHRPRGQHEFISSQFWNAATTEIAPNGWIFIGYGPRRSTLRSSNDAMSLLRAPPRTSAVVTLFRDDAALEKGHEWLSGLAAGAIRGDSAKEDTLEGVLRILSDKLLDPNMTSTMRVADEGLEVQLAPNQEFISVKLLGDGYRMLIEMVLDILYQIERFKPDHILWEISKWPPAPEGKPRIRISGVIAIDEPENHLHPSVQQRLGFWFKEHFPRVQFLVATHSAIICQAAERGGLMRMPSPFALEFVDDENWEAITNGTIDDAISTRLFGLPTPYAPEGLKLREELSNLESEMQRREATTAQIARREEILSQLPNSVDAGIAAALNRLAERRR